MDRRRFLGASAGAAVGALGIAAVWEGLVREHLDDANRSAAPAGSPPFVPPAPERRVLVVLELGGGNDGLNTFVPVGDGRYHDARPNLAVAEGEVLPLSGTTDHGAHPALAPLVPHWEAGTLLAVDGVGFPEQTRSHFAARDHWHAGGEPARTGWLGRWLDATADPPARGGLGSPGSPGQGNPLRAIALGRAAQSLAAEHHLSTVVVRPKGLVLQPNRGRDAVAVREALLASAAPLAPRAMEAAAQQAMPAALQAVDLMAQAAAAGAAPDDDPAPAVGDAEGTRTITDRLATAAGIVALDVGTQVIVVSVEGFDTHSDQAARHPDLLADLARGIDGFRQAVARAGRSDDVLLMTVSEFGRRVRDNGSGTDHGSAGLQVLEGPMVAGGQLMGRVDLGDLDEGDLRIEVDARSLYASGLDWLSGSPDVTDAVLAGGADRLGMLRAS